MAAVRCAIESLVSWATANDRGKCLMRYYRPDTIDEALGLLAQDEDARCLAGGATLVAMMNANLVKPSALISLKGIASLKGVSEVSQGFKIGAMTNHCAVANDLRLQGGLAVVRLAAGQIGHPAIRSVGTIGGSIAHADPAADYPTALVAAGAIVEVAGSEGTRRLVAHEFFKGYYTTAVQTGEMVVAVHLVPPAVGSVSAYRKVGRSDGDFATASIAFCAKFEGRECVGASVAVGGCASTPVRSAEANALLVGAAEGSSRISQAAEALIEKCDPIDDVRGTADYRRTLVRRLLPRVFAQTLAASK